MPTETSFIWDGAVVLAKHPRTALRELGWWTISNLEEGQRFATDTRQIDAFAAVLKQINLVYCAVSLAGDK